MIFLKKSRKGIVSGLGLFLILLSGCSSNANEILGDQNVNHDLAYQAGDVGATYHYVPLNEEQRVEDQSITFRSTMTQKVEERKYYVANVEIRNHSNEKLTIYANQFGVDAYDFYDQQYLYQGSSFDETKEVTAIEIEANTNQKINVYILVDSLDLQMNVNYRVNKNEYVGVAKED